MKWRQSFLGSADDCLRKLQYQIEDPVRRSGSVRAIGTGYHAGLERLYASRMNGTRDTLLPVDLNVTAVSAFNEEIRNAGDTFLWDEKFPDKDSAIAVMRSMLETFWDNGYELPPDWEVLGCEVSFEIPWHNGHTKGGTIDLVLRDPNGWIVAEDHKTAGKMWPQGKENPRKNNQVSWYVPALQHLYPGAPGYRFMFGIMTYAGKFERRVVDPRPEHFEAVDRKAIQIATLVDGMKSAGLDLPANPSSTLCNPKWCDYFDVCPHGRVLD